MRNPLFFYLAIALVVIGIVVGIYYLIPGFHHIIGFSFNGRGATDPNATRPLHAVAGFVVAIIGVVLVPLTRPKKV